MIESSALNPTLHSVGDGGEALRQTASRLVNLGRPFVFSVAKTKSEKSLIYSQRYEVIQARDWGDLSDYPDAQEFDHYDDDALHIQGLDQGQLVASARLVFPGQKRVLPIQQSHAIDLCQPEKHVEIGRMIVTAPGPSFPRKFLFSALIGSVLVQAFDASFFHVLAVANKSMLRLYRRFGITAQIIGDPVTVCHDQRYPVLIDVPTSLHQLDRFISQKS